MFVGGIPADAQDDELKSYFEGVCGGNVAEHAIVRKEGQSEKKDLFGFVTFETSEIVDEVLLQRESLNFKGKELTVNRAVPKDTKEDELMKYLKARHPSKYGAIESIQLIQQG